MDLIPYTNFDFEQFRCDFRRLNHDAAVFQISCKTSGGIEEWAHWIEHVCAGELHFEPHTHGHDDLAGVIQPHQHPHRQHHEGVVRG